jgi:thioredoxin-like negative regulator of GroEL
MNIAKRLKQAEKLTSYGNTEEAIEVYQEILEENPENTAVHGLIADLYLVTRQYGPAARH